VNSPVRLTLGGFARSAIEERLGSDLRVAVITALLHYARRVKSGRRPVPPPRFYRDRPGEADGTTLELQISPETLASLEAQAGLHQVSLNQIMVHAIFVYLADLESPSDTPGRGGSPPDRAPEGDA
jgi:hypothetical protein